MVTKNELINLLPAIRMILSGGEQKVLTWVDAHRYDQQHIENYRESAVFLKEDSTENRIRQVQERAVKDPLYLFIAQAGAIVASNSKSNTESLVRSLTANTSPDVSTASPAGRVANKIIIVTGGAQGFGSGIAEGLFREGANIVIADLNEEKGKDLARGLNAEQKPNRVWFVKTDVSSPASVEELIHETVKEFGGLDGMISNAGILRAGGLDEMDAETFERMTRVNYTGYYTCAKHAAAVMKQQHRYNKEGFFDIIQINSKSGLKGSKKNFAYAGAKFGGIGLTQSFALELMPYQIKVNSICPGNFFEGPLWSDPDKGLFVQYLNAGKVPGAKSIEDVKNHYEQQVPAGRGCRVEDVVRAIFYAMEQEYETGQAIPVTGGQQMLH